MAVAKLADSMEVCLEGGSLLAGGTLLLEQVAPETSARQDDSGAGAVLGVATPGGSPATHADFALGKVGAICLLIRQ